MADVKAPIKVEISHKTVIFTVLLLIGVWFLVQIREIITVIFLSVILLSALLKPVEWLNKHKIPRVIAVIIVYIFIITIIAFCVGIIVPPLVEQSRQFGSKFPQIISSIKGFVLFNQIDANNLSEAVSKQIRDISGDLIRVTTTIFSSIFLLLTIFVITFYLLLDWNKFIRVLASPFSGKQERKIIKLVASIENGLGRWLRGQIALSLIVGSLVFIGLTILQVPFALPLALIAGILEIIPIIGPIISSIPAIIVGFTISPLIGIAVGALYIIIQQLENNLIVPIIMSKVIGLQPPVIIIALLIGAKIAGIGGAFLAPPAIILVKIFIQEFLVEDQKFEDDLIEQ